MSITYSHDLTTPASCTPTPASHRRPITGRPSTTTGVPRDAREAAPPCATHAELFQHPLLEDAESLPTRNAALTRSLRVQAEQVCGQCPLITACLYRAVVEHDVAGYVAGSTEAQRRAIRRELGITVPRDDLSAWTGNHGGNRRISTDDVLRLRCAHPNESLPELAVRLGCSLSTIKRHLRAHRDGNPITTDVRTGERPGLDAVLASWRRVCSGVHSRLAA